MLFYTFLRRREFPFVNGRWYFLDTFLFLETQSVSVNPLGPNIHKQILQTDLHTFPLRISWENLIKGQSIFS